MRTLERDKIPECYKSLSVSPNYLKNLYNNAGLSYKIKNSKLDNFTIEESVDIELQQEIIQNSTKSMSLFVPVDVIACIIDFSLSPTQLFIEFKSKQIYNNININYIIPLNIYICREIASYCGGYSWDGEFWCYRSMYPLNKYAYMNRVVYWCGNQDVIYCKSDEFCYGSRYFVKILIDHKHDEMWCGIMFNDLSKWSSYYREKNQIAYYAGRRRTTVNLKAKFKIKYPKLFNDIIMKSTGENKTLELEMNMIENKNDLMNRQYLWDMGFGIIQGRGKLLSNVLPWYGSGDYIAILVDTKEGVVYFFREEILVWFIHDVEIKNKKNKCKIFGCTDLTDDTLIYERVLWNNNHEKDLQAQIYKIKNKIDLYHADNTD